MAGVPAPPPPLCKAHADVRLSGAIRAQVRNGAWQPWACTRLPECNFPVITLPSFSASVKDHPGTQRSRACWQKDRPSLQITLHWWREPTRPEPDLACTVSPRDRPSVPHRSGHSEPLHRPLSSGTPSLPVSIFRGCHDTHCTVTYLDSFKVTLQSRPPYCCPSNSPQPLWFCLYVITHSWVLAGHHSHR